MLRTMPLVISMLWLVANLSSWPAPTFAQSSFASYAIPHWIWGTSADSGGADFYEKASLSFEKSFEITEPIQMARLRVAADFCHITVSSNGQPVAKVEAMSPTLEIDITNALQRGGNTLRIEARAIPGPAAIALSLELRTTESRTTLVSDESWTIASADGSSAEGEPRMTQSLGKVAAELWGIGRQGIDLDANENYEQWRLAESGKILAENQFAIAPGFKISLVRSALPEEDSWVSLAFDPQGRMIVAKETQGLLRMTLDPANLAVEKVDLINRDLRECRGIVFADGAMYVNANNSKGLYRLQDTDGNDRLDHVELLREFPGGVGHGRNDLAVGRDAWIYSVHGDSVDVPLEDRLDRTSPLSDAANGGSGRKGHVMRTKVDGAQWEIFCGGLRNSFGLAVNPDGELFTYDADAEFDMGAPWYRGTRILHLVSGADYGWRAVTGQWPPYYPDHVDNAQPLLEIGKGSPTAAMFGTAARFPEPYRRALFVLDWTYGRILAIHLAPRGAGYRAAAETFLQGRPLNVTDIAIGPRGAMFILTGGRGTQSAIYRIEYEATRPEAPPTSNHERAAAAHAEPQRKLRHQLETLHGQSDRSLDLAWQHLDSFDGMLRYAARIAIEHQPLDVWRVQALQEKRPRATIEALLALARSGDAELAPAVIELLLGLPDAPMQLEQVMGVLRCYALFQNTAREAVQSRRAAIVVQIDSLMTGLLADGLQICRSGSSAQLQRDAALLLAQLDADQAIGVTAGWLLDSASQVDQLQALFALRNKRTGWTDETRHDYFRRLGESSQFVGGEGMPRFLSKIKADALASLDASQAAELADLINPPAMAAEPLPPERPLVKQWTIDELAALLEKSEHAPDRQRGEVLFRDALCNRCHRHGVRGPAVGPDLTHVGKRFSRRDLLQSILLPSAAVAENYRSLLITTVDGQIISGRVVSEGDYRSQKLQLATDPLRAAALVEVDKREIESIRESQTSPMPTGLLDSLHADEILDLLEYLVYGSN